MCLNNANKISVDKEIHAYKVVRRSVEGDHFITPYKLAKVEFDKEITCEIDSKLGYVGKALHCFKKLEDAVILAASISESIVVDAIIPKDAEIYKGVFISYEADHIVEAESYASSKIIYKMR